MQRFTSATASLRASKSSFDGSTHALLIELAIQEVCKRTDQQHIRTELLRWLQNASITSELQQILPGPRIVMASGWMALLHWSREHLTRGFTTDAMDDAVEHGQLVMVRFLHENRSEGCTTQAMDGAADGGYLNAVQYLHHHRSDGCTVKAIDWAAGGGHLDVAFLYENRTEGCTSDATDWAAEGRYLAVLQFLHQRRMARWTAAAIAWHFFVVINCNHVY